MSKDRKSKQALDHHSLHAVNAIVLGTVNAPYKRSISADELTLTLATANAGEWLVHVATFFTDVRPTLLIDFATAHSVGHTQLQSAYFATRQATGECNAELEATLVALAQAA